MRTRSISLLCAGVVAIGLAISPSASAHVPMAQPVPATTTQFLATDVQHSMVSISDGGAPSPDAGTTEPAATTECARYVVGYEENQKFWGKVRTSMRLRQCISPEGSITFKPVLARGSFATAAVTGKCGLFVGKTKLVEFRFALVSPSGREKIVTLKAPCKKSKGSASFKFGKVKPFPVGTAWQIHYHWYAYGADTEGAQGGTLE